MSKRKRLDPARLVGGGEDTETPVQTLDPGLETKSMFGSFPNGVARYAARAPVASVAGDAALAAALDEVSGELTRARAEGRMVQALPLASIVVDHLVRDRLPVWDEAMEALLGSLRDRGQQTPIEVVRLSGGRYGLISGWRRLAALTRLAAEPGGAGEAATVLALERSPADAAAAYLAMVEENEVRVDLSHYERARIAVKAVEHGAYPSQKAALLALFRNASRSRRSKIRSFIPLVEQLDEVLRFPTQLGERLGLSLGAALVADAGLAVRLEAALERAAPADAETEQAMIREVLKPQEQGLARGSDTESEGRAPATPQAGPPEAPIRPGLSLLRAPGGGLLLQGPAVDAAFEARLRAWLAEG